MSKMSTSHETAEQHVKNIRRATRKQYSAEEKIRVVLAVGVGVNSDFHESNLSKFAKSMRPGPSGCGPWALWDRSRSSSCRPRRCRSYCRNRFCRCCTRLPRRGRILPSCLSPSGMVQDWETPDASQKVKGVRGPGRNPAPNPLFITRLSNP